MTTSAEAAAECRTDKPDGAFGTGRRREARCSERGDGFHLVESGADGGGLRVQVDGRRLQFGDVDDHSVVHGAPPLQRAPAAA